MRSPSLPCTTGKFSLGTEVNVLPAAIEACRARGGLVVAQVNRHMPWTYGDGLLDPDDVDVVFDADAPLDEPTPTTPDDAARRIGELVAARMQDGATLQLGIGMVPDATLPGLRQRRGLGDLVGDVLRRCPRRSRRQAHSIPRTP